MKRSAVIRICLVVAISLSLGACSSVSVRPEGGAKLTTAPTYLDSKPFYLFGLIGRHEVDVNAVCEGAEVLQMQTVRTMNDYLIGFVTWFIYSPRTAKVWCGE